MKADSDRLTELRERVRSSLWPVPAFFVVMSTVLAVALTELDRGLEGLAGVRFVFAGSPEAGRSVLSVISGSMVSLTALVFSILIVVFQLTSSQFTPRALRTFLQDRPSKVALGSFLGTFAFSLTVMRTVRGEDGDITEFVPRISITVAFFFSLLSMGVFVYYIHHVSRSIRASSIMQRIHRETTEVIGRLLPEEEEEEVAAVSRLALPEEAVETLNVRSRKAGYITAIDTEHLVEEAEEAGTLVVVLHQVGTFVPLGVPLLAVRPPTEAESHEGILKAVHLAEERTMEQDLGYGFRQLADLAVRALSPSMNDPTTAAMAIDRIGDLLLRVGRRPVLHDLRYDEGGRLRVVVPRHTWQGIVHEALQEIFYYGRDSPQVEEHLRQLLKMLRDELSSDRMIVIEREAARQGFAAGKNDSTE
jgi:uncharacterized membrane protein